MEQNISIQKIIELANHVAEIRKKWEEKNANSINVITSMAYNHTIREEAHSRVLAELLRIGFIKESFIQTFLNDDGEFKDIDSYEVETEKGKIDVSLYSESERKFIIIENKINAAEERKSQIAQYVENTHTEKYIPYENIFVVYLNPDNPSMPSTRSSTLNGKSLFDIEGFKEKHFKALSYKQDITDWLKRLKEIAVFSPKLESALIQYIDYLEEKFNNTDMAKEINNILEKVLRLDGMEEMAKFDKIQTLEGELSKLQDDMREYKKFLAKDTVRGWRDEVEKSGISLIPDDKSIIDIQLDNFKGVCFTITYSIEDNYTPSWYFWENEPETITKDKENCKRILEAIKILGTSPKENAGGMIYWDVIPKDIDVPKLVELVCEAAKKLPELNS